VSGAAADGDATTDSTTHGARETRTRSGPLSGGMAVVERRVGCAAEVVVEVLEDGWLYAGWVVGASRIREVDAHWPEPGAAIHHSAGVWPFVLNDKTVSRRWDPRGRLELQAHGWPLGEARVVIDVRPEGPASCRVVLAEDAVKGPGTLVPRVARTAAIVPRNKEALHRLALIAEGRARGHGVPPGGTAGRATGDRPGGSAGEGAATG
jgi:hypothetical protein